MFTGLNIVGSSVDDNVNLDQDSKDYLSTLNSQLNNNNSEDSFNYLDSELETNVDAKSDESDDFSLQFEMSRGAASSNQESLKTITKAPSLVYYAFGLDSTEWTPFRVIIAWFLGVTIAAIVFVLVFGPGRIFGSGGD